MVYIYVKRRIQSPFYHIHRQNEGSNIEFSIRTIVGYVFMKLNMSQIVNYKMPKHVARKQWRSWVFGAGDRVIATAAPYRKYELKQITISY